MSLDPATVRRIAKLACIRVEEDQLPQLQAELNASWAGSSSSTR